MTVGIPPVVIHSGIHTHTDSSTARIVPPSSVKLQGEYGWLETVSSFISHTVVVTGETGEPLRQWVKRHRYHTHKHPGVLIHPCEKKSSSLFNLLNIHICACVCTCSAARRDCPPFVPYAYFCPQAKSWLCRYMEIKNSSLISELFWTWSQILHSLNFTSIWQNIKTLKLTSYSWVVVLHNNTIILM